MSAECKKILQSDLQRHSGPFASDILQVYKAWVDPNALTAYGGPSGSNEDSTDSFLVEGNGLFTAYEVLVFAIDSSCFSFLYWIISENGSVCVCVKKLEIYWYKVLWMHFCSFKF